MCVSRVVVIAALCALFMSALPDRTRAAMAPPTLVGVAMTPDRGRDAKWWRLFKAVEFRPQLARMRACLADALACDDRPLQAWRADALRAGADPRAHSRAVSARLGYVDDATGHWLGPVTAYAHGGDCEDHAVTKMASLLAVGVRDTQLFVLVLRARDPRMQDHAVLAMRSVDGWRYFDMNQHGERSAAWLNAHYAPAVAYRADGAVFRAA